MGDGHPIKEKIIQMFKDHNVDLGTQIDSNKLNLTNIPSDAFMSTVYLRKSEHLSKDYDTKHYCFMCGREHDTDEDLLNCMQSHIKDMLAGIPIARTEEHKHYIAQQLHPEMHDMAMDVLNGHPTIKKEDKK